MDFEIIKGCKSCANARPCNYCDSKYEGYLLSPYLAQDKKEIEELESALTALRQQNAELREMLSDALLYTVNYDKQKQAESLIKEG